MSDIKKKILVVDDEKNIRLLIAQCLEEAGYEVTAAVDGEHALAKFQEQEFQLVLLDMKLPGIDGLQVLSKIKSLHPSQAIVIITAHGSIETAVEAMKLGASDYLQKPFTPDEIKAIVHHNIYNNSNNEMPDSTVNYADLNRKARNLLENNKPEQAITILRRVIHKDPERPEAFNLMGVAQELLGNVNVARRMYSVTLALEPSYKPASINLERVCQWKYDIKGINYGDYPQEKLPWEK